MKTVINRVLPFLLLACMLLAALPFGAFAAEVNYTWNAVGEDSAFYKDCCTLVDGSDRDFKIKVGGISAYAGGKAKAEGYQLLINNKNENNTSFIGIQFNTVKAGNYTVKFTPEATSNNCTYKIHVFPKSFFDDCPNTSTSNAKAASAIEAGSHKVSTVTIAKGDTTPFTFSAEFGDNPIIVFSAEKDAGKVFFRFTELSITGTSDAPQATDPSEPAVTDPSEPAVTDPSEPAVTDPSEPAATDPSTPAATQPATNAPAGSTDADSSSFPTAAIVILAVIIVGGIAASAVLFLKGKKKSAE